MYAGTTILREPVCSINCFQINNLKIMAVRNVEFLSGNINVHRISSPRQNMLTVIVIAATTTFTNDTCKLK
jgi:hypothetical protein